MAAIGGALQTGLPMTQEWRHHEKDVELAHTLHEKEVKLAQEFHRIEYKQAESYHYKEMEISKKIYLWDASTQLEQHFQQLNADLISANRESDRDMYEQRNAQFQTIIVSSTVMFAALCTVIIEGALPTNAGAVVENTMALSAGLSFAFLFLSIVLSLKVVIRATRFMYKRSHVNNETARSLFRKTKEVLGKMREIRNLSQTQTTSEAIDRRFETHFKHIQRWMEEREDILDQLFPGGVASPEDSAQCAPRPPSIHKTVNQVWKSLRGGGGTSFPYETSFAEYWVAHCKKLSTSALRMFYLGTALLLVAIAVFVYAKFRYVYTNSSAGLITASCIGISLVIGLLASMIPDFDSCGAPDAMPYRPHPMRRSNTGLTSSSAGATHMGDDSNGFFV